MARVNITESNKKHGMALFTDSIHREEMIGSKYEIEGFIVFVDDVDDSITVTSSDLFNGGFDGAMPCFVFDGSMLGSFPYQISTVIKEVLELHYVPFAYCEGITSTRLDLNWGGVDLTFWATPRMDGSHSLSVKNSKNILATNEKKANPFLSLMGGVK